VTRPNHPFCFHSRTPEETRDIAGILARQVGANGAVINLNGELGAGKTVFAKGLAVGLGLDGDAVSSPTFTLVNEYPLVSGERFVHADFYRLESEAALEGVGFLDFLEAGTVLVAEWGDRFPDAFPKDHLRIEIRRPRARNGEGSERDEAGFRIIEVQAVGVRAAELVQNWRRALSRRDEGEPEVVCS